MRKEAEARELEQQIQNTELYHEYKRLKRDKKRQKKEKIGKRRVG